MRVSFVKMHGLGNDFVVLDARDEPLPPFGAATAAAIAHRRTGIGCDQLILLERSAAADFRMRIFNPDGGEVGACGNASRAVALLHGRAARVETAGGEIMMEPTADGARIDMGVPRFDWDAVPLAYPLDTAAMPIAWEALENPAAVNVGNPHAVFFVPDLDDVPLERLGPEIERDALFPERVNVNVAEVTGPASIALKVWERGAGLTRACGTGACATTVAAIRRGLIEGRRAAVTLPGGVLEIEWLADDRIMMTGPAAESFRGSFEWDDFA